jgi:N-acetylneuraminate synthase/N,N'-diacetyllegionaminate synthase
MEMLDWIDPYLDFYKIGSGDLTAWPLLRELARRGKPILLSTGLATMEDVLQAVRQMKRVDERYGDPAMLCLMQCTSMYPIPNGDANLQVMDALRGQTNLAVGYSDHTVGSAALTAAAAMGAEVLEFHFTDNREGKTFRDHQISLTPADVRQLHLEVSKIQLLRGNFVKQPVQSELEAGHDLSFRRGVYLRRNVSAGEQIFDTDLVLMRPNIGIDARDVDRVIGRTAKADIDAFQALSFELLERKIN